jgi:hypothetical protein
VVEPFDQQRPLIFARNSKTRSKQAMGNSDLRFCGVRVCVLFALVAGIVPSSNAGPLQSVLATNVSMAVTASGGGAS